MSRIGYLVVLSIVLISGVSAQKSTDPRNNGPWNYDPSSNVVSAPAGSKVVIGTPCPAGAPSGSVCMNGQAMTPISVSALPAASAVNANVIQVVSNTTNCTNTSGTNPILCISTGTVWAPLGGASASSAPPYTGGLVAEYRLDEQVGRSAFNSVSPHTPSNNMLGVVTDFNTGTGTVTTNYATNRDGYKIASRLQIASGSNFKYFQSQGSINIMLAGGVYTISLDCISNTGSAQNIRLGDYNTSTSGNLVCGTTWTRVSYTLTEGGGSPYVVLYTDVAGDALDISYDRLQVELGSAPTAFDSHLWNIQLGANKWVNDTTVPSWTNTPWLTWTGIERASGLGNWAPITLSQMSMYAVVQQTSDATVGQPVFGDLTGAVGLWPSVNGAADYKVVFGGNLSGGGNTYSASAGPCIRINDGYPHVLAGTYDGTTIRAYLDGVQVSSKTIAVAPQTISTLALGGISTSFQYIGRIGYASLYNYAHSAATVQSNTARLAALMAQRGVTIPAWRNWIVWEGDSITAGAEGTPWPWTAAMALTPFPQGNLAAIYGSKMSDLASRNIADNAMLQPGSTQNLLTVLIGANDMGDTGGASGFVAALKAYCLAQRAAGWNKIVVLTILPQTTSGFNAFRDAANALIVADTSFYDAIVRLDQDSVIGCDACAANTTYYNTDGIHPTTAGENLLAADVVPVLRSILQ